MYKQGFEANSALLTENGTSIPWPRLERTHPNLTLAVLALGGMAYALLSSAVVPALPTMEHDLSWRC